MRALVLSVFLMGVLLKGLAASAAKHAAQTAPLSLSVSLPLSFSLFCSLLFLRHTQSQTY